MDTKNHQWRILDHVCRVCLGRLLERSEDGKRIVRCAECGLEAEGVHRDLCACGVRQRGGKDAGMRCGRNPGISPERPQEIVVLLGGAPLPEESTHG